MYVKKTENTEITKTESRGKNVHQSIESMNENTPEEAERGSALRMSSPWKKVVRRPGAERMCPAEYMGPGARCDRAWRCPAGGYMTESMPPSNTGVGPQLTRIHGSRSTSLPINRTVRPVFLALVSQEKRTTKSHRERRCAECALALVVGTNIPFTQALVYNTRPCTCCRKQLSLFSSSLLCERVCWVGCSMPRTSAVRVPPTRA